MGMGGVTAMARQVVAAGQAAGAAPSDLAAKKKKKRGLLAGAAGAMVGGVTRTPSGGAPTSVAPTAQTKAY